MPMNRHTLFILLMFANACPLSVAQQHKDPLPSLLPEPDAIQGWSRPDTARIYKGGDLYLFIDGGADLFFEYGFRQALAVEYQNVRGESINLEIYEMNDPGAAYGIYSLRSGDEATPLAIGQGGSAHSYYIMFWKGRYFVSVAASDSTELCRKGLETLARAIDRNASEQGRKPRVVDLLPKENLLKQRYVRGHLGLSTIHPFDTRDLFHSDEGAVGKYKDHSIFIMLYASAAEAQHRLEEIGRTLRATLRYTNYTVRDQMTTVSDGKNRVLCLAQAGVYIVASLAANERVAGASCRHAAGSLGIINPPLH